MEQRPDWAPDDVDITRPSVARVYDYALGGSHNFAADREFAARMFAAMPDAPRMLRDNRFFLQRAVRQLCAAGMDQFLDLGAGIPTVGNVHEITAEHRPGARVVYVDHDPVAAVHGRALLGDDPATTVLHADLRHVERVLAAPEVAGHLDLTRPVAVLLVSVLQFVPDDDRPADVVAAYLTALAPGSHLVISHPTVEHRQDAGDAAALFNQDRSPNPMRPRTRSEVHALFAGLPLVEPGLVPLPRWRPDDTQDVPADADRHAFYAGVGRKDQS